jgi:hypothetical protein
MLKKTLATAGIALAVIIATPFAANAATPYVAADNTVVSDSTPAPGQAVTVAFENSFTAGEGVRFSVTGEGAVTIAAVTTASVTKTATAAGNVSAVVTPPANASGSYTVTATGLTSGTVGTAALTVVAANSPAGSNNNAAGNNGVNAGNLASTGGNLPIAAIWIASGVLVLGIVLVAVVGIRRRSLNN